MPAAFVSSHVDGHKIHILTDSMDIVPVSNFLFIKRRKRTLTPPENTSHPYTPTSTARRPFPHSS